MSLLKKVNRLYDEVERLDEERLFNYLDKGITWILSDEYNELYDRIETLDFKIELYEMLLFNQIELSN